MAKKPKFDKGDTLALEAMNQELEALKAEQEKARIIKQIQEASPEELSQLAQAMQQQGQQGGGQQGPPQGQPQQGLPGGGPSQGFPGQGQPQGPPQGLPQGRGGGNLPRYPMGGSFGGGSGGFGGGGGGGGFGGVASSLLGSGGGNQSEQPESIYDQMGYGSYEGSGALNKIASAIMPGLGESFMQDDMERRAQPYSLMGMRTGVNTPQRQQGFANGGDLNDPRLNLQQDSIPINPRGSQNPYMNPEALAIQEGRRPLFASPQIPQDTVRANQFQAQNFQGPDQPGLPQTGLSGLAGGLSQGGGQPQIAGQSRFAYGGGLPQYQGYGEDPNELVGGGIPVVDYTTTVPEFDYAQLEKDAFFENALSPEELHQRGRDRRKEGRQQTMAGIKEQLGDRFLGQEGDPYKSRVSLLGAGLDAFGAFKANRNIDLTADAITSPNIVARNYDYGAARDSLGRDRDRATAAVERAAAQRGSRSGTQEALRYGRGEAQRTYAKGITGLYTGEADKNVAAATAADAQQAQYDYQTDIMNQRREDQSQLMNERLRANRIQGLTGSGSGYLRDKQAASKYDRMMDIMTPENYQYQTAGGDTWLNRILGFDTPGHMVSRGETDITGDPLAEGADGAINQMSMADKIRFLAQQFGDQGRSGFGMFNGLLE